MSNQATEEHRKDYLTELVPPFNVATAVEEASRCLICMDAPCSAGCPADTNPGDFIRAIRFRNFKGAAEIIQSNNVLGGICARICPYEVLCEKECARTDIDKPIQIGRLQRFAVDYARAAGFQPYDKVESTKEKVAMIGSGPASLTCAAELAQKGYKVTVFEEKEKPGGVMSYGIFPGRLPQYVVDEEIETIKKLGVDIVCNTRIGQDKSIEDLRNEGYKAFFVGPGNQGSRVPEVPGLDLEGVTTAVAYLGRARSSGGRVDPGKRVVIIGGGDVAMDCASTAHHLGAEKVMILYRRTRNEAPAHVAELSHVENLGVQFHYGFIQDEIIGKDGKVVAIKGKGFKDSSTIELECDTVVFAIGQKPDKSVRNIAGVEFTTKDAIVADENVDCKTNIPYIFAGGDIVNGGKTVVQAVKAGKIAAENIDQYIREAK